MKQRVCSIYFFLMRFILSLFIFIAIAIPGGVFAQETPTDMPLADAYIFARDNCAHCQDLESFITQHDIEQGGYTIVFIDVATPAGKKLFDHATKILKTGKITPIILVDGQVYAGFSEEVVGQKLIEHAQQKERKPLSFASYLTQDAPLQTGGAGCREGSLVPCTSDEKAQQSIRIPVLGTVNPHTLSLSFMAVVLGFVDGFNPCAMWVLLTFLLVLSQAGNRKKMVHVAGLFIIAEAMMYYLILNVWYQTWDFIALDNIVTPAVGVLAVGSGIFFLYKYWTSRNKPLTCDGTSTKNRIKDSRADFQADEFDGGACHYRARAFREHH